MSTSRTSERHATTQITPDEGRFQPARTPESFDYECEMYRITTDSDGARYFAFLLHTYRNGEAPDSPDDEWPEWRDEDERLPYECQSPMPHDIGDTWWVVPLADFLEDARKISFGEFVRHMVAFTNSGDPNIWVTYLEYADEEGVASLWMGCDESNHLPISELDLETPDGTYWCGELE